MRSETFVSDNRKRSAVLNIRAKKSVALDGAFAVLDPLLGRNTIKKGKAIKIGDKEIEYHPNFKLILHTKLANDPAYNAVANGSASVKDFTNKYIVQGKPEKLANMRDNLVGNDVAQQTIRATLLDTLRDKAALNDKYEGNFASNSFNKALDRITPNGRLVFNDGELQTLGSLGQYAADAHYHGADWFKNFSNTSTALDSPTHAMSSKLGELATTGAEALLSAKTGGLSAPITATIRAGLRAKAEQRAALQEQLDAANYVHDATRPAAGLIKK